MRRRDGNPVSVDEDGCHEDVFATGSLVLAPGSTRRCDRGVRLAEDAKPMIPLSGPIGNTTGPPRGGLEQAYFWSGW